LIQGFHLGAVLGERIGLTDEEWALIGPLLPADEGAAVARRKTIDTISKA
jgi:hypothetical protein